MKILSHRGFWKDPTEKNTEAAFERSFSMGFGTETDLRDALGSLVVAHDPPVQGALAADVLFEIHGRHDPKLTLALNVKADGLQHLVADHLERHPATDAFVFDMSIPDTLQWLKAGIPVFTRHSDVEPEPALYEESVGIWLDAFHSDWWGPEVVFRHLEARKRVCIVSPDLHRRAFEPVWEMLSKADFSGTEDRVMLCTDHPEEARRAFPS